MYPKSQVVWIFWVVWTFSATFEILFNYEWGDLKLESTLGEVVFFFFFSITNIYFGMEKWLDRHSMDNLEYK